MDLGHQKFYLNLKEYEKHGLQPFPALYNSILGADSSRIINSR